MIKIIFTIAELKSNQNEYDNGIVDYELRIETKNKRTGKFGHATIHRGYKTITVYEGSGDEVEEKVMSIIDFVNNYDYQLGDINKTKQIEF